MDQTLPVDIERKKFTGIAARAMALVISGCTQAQAARAIGVSESLVSQYMSDPEFALQVAEGARAELEKASAIDGNYLEIERVLSERLMTMTGMMVSADQVLKTLRVVNGMNSRQHRAYNGNENPSAPVAGESRGASKLQLPQVIVNNYVVSPQGEVVSVGNRILSTLNSSSMDALVAAKNAAPKPAINSESVRIKEITHDPPAAGQQQKVSKDKWGDL